MTAATDLFLAWTPLASHAVTQFLDQFDLETDVDPLADWLFGRAEHLDGGALAYASPELVLGAAPVQPVGADLFEVDDDGTWAVLQPIGTLDGDILDLIAWHPSAPDRWRFLRGDGEALGEREIWLRQDHDDGPLQVFATPLAWHRAGGRGVCVLRRDWPTVQRLFVGERELIAETIELGDRLDMMLSYRPAPAIYLHHDRERAA